MRKLTNDLDTECKVKAVPLTIKSKSVEGFLQGCNEL